MASNSTSPRQRPADPAFNSGNSTPAQRLHLSLADIRDSAHEAAEALVSSLNNGFDPKKLTQQITDSFIQVVAQVLDISPADKQLSNTTIRHASLPQKSKSPNASNKKIERRSSYKEAIATLAETQNRMDVDPTHSVSDSENMEFDTIETVTKCNSTRVDEIETLKKRILELENYIASQKRCSADLSPAAFRTRTKNSRKEVTPYSCAADILRRHYPSSTDTDLTPVFTLLADMHAVNTDSSDLDDATSDLYD
jgi:hypothetical protein